jgi:CubicO group peptidase (beta-lactamase class C family)
MTRLPLLALALAALTLAPHVSAAQDMAAVERSVDSIFAGIAGGGVRPGVAVSVVRDGRVLLSKGYGYADLEHRVPITGATVFDMASVSKQFTGLAIAMLVEQGRIRLADDVRRYIPELEIPGQTITIGHLVHHTSGLRDWPGTLGLAGWRMDDVISFDQILSMAFRQRTLNFQPGAEYTYSNTGYNMLAEVVKRVTGQSFRAWTDSTFFRPLGMSSTHFRDDHTEVFPNRAFGYARTPSGGWRHIPNNLVALGSSSLFSSADDMARWVTNFDRQTVGGREAIALMRTTTPLNDGSVNSYAFGLSVGPYRGQPTLNHRGGWAAFGTFLLHFPAQRFGVVVLSNGGGVNAGAAAYMIADRYLASELGPRAPTPPTTSDATVAVSVPAATLDRYAGLYKLGPGWYVRIRRDGATLRTQATGEDEFPMTARSDTSFWVANYGQLMTFPRVAVGRPPELLYRGRRYPRVAEPSHAQLVPLTAAQLAEFVGEYESPELDTRYRVTITDGALVLRHFRHGAVTLTQVYGTEFSGRAPYARSITFQRNAAGRVSGFSVDIDERSRDIRFVKRPSA